jgi:tRNA-specific 2-thiouridylase
MGSSPFVVVAMSGGVDSSVAAALLVEQGYRVVGMMLRLWSEPGLEDSNRCCTPDAMAQARSVAQQLGIPFYAVDVRDRFRATVVQSFIAGYRNGQTPNPCVVCNREIRWGALYEQARTSGADFLATGHYARIGCSDAGLHQLLKGIDNGKDQSYVLSVISQDQLNHSLFPVGEYPKTLVRELAQKFNLKVASRPDSQDLCFLAGQDYRDFLKRNAPESIRPGLIQGTDGAVFGEHQGLAFYTIGQRKGLGLSSPDSLYVIRKDADSNVLIIGNEAALGSDDLVAGDLNWLEGKPPADEFYAEVKIRYKAREVSARIYVTKDDRVHVKFKQPLRDITPGQRAVFYQGDVCLGGGTILSSEENP